MSAASSLITWVSTFVAFVVVGFIPLLMYVLELGTSLHVADPFVFSAAFTAAAFFVVGALKSVVTGERWFGGGLETLGIGGLAAVLAYFVGMLLAGLA